MRTRKAFAKREQSFQCMVTEYGTGYYPTRSYTAGYYDYYGYPYSYYGSMYERPVVRSGTRYNDAYGPRYCGSRIYGDWY
jgi:hypothetical protein